MKGFAKRLQCAMWMALVAISLSTPAFALWTANPAVNLAVRTGVAEQHVACALPDGAGGIIVIWLEIRYSIPLYEVRAQRIGPDGTLLWPAEGIVISTGSHDLNRVVAAADHDGGVYVAWSRQGADGFYDIYAQYLTASGGRPWGSTGVPVCAASRSQYVAPLVLTPQGSAIVSWSDARNPGANGDQFDIYSQKLNRDGSTSWQTDGVPVCVTATDHGVDVATASDGANGAYVVWIERRYGQYGLMYAQRLDASGAPIWLENGAQISPVAGVTDVRSIIPLAGGGFALSYNAATTGYENTIYTQRISPAGIPQWSNGGKVLFANYSRSYLQGVVGDGAGNVITFCRLVDASGYDSGARAQAVSDAGTMPWGSEGIALGSATAFQYATSISDSGNIFVGLYRPEATLHLEKIDASGGKVWGIDPVVASSTTSSYSYGALLSDGAGGVYAVWTDYRNGNPDIYAHHVPAGGPPGPEPVITSVRDVPYDQGGKIKVSWLGCYHDIAPIYGISSYLIWRSVPDSAAQAKLAHGAHVGVPEFHDSASTDVWMTTTTDPQGKTIYWEYVGSQLAVGDPGYSYVVPTTSDSLPGANPYTLVRVQARAAAGTAFYSSEPDSGYSTDNLAPARPTGLRQYGTALVWEPSTASDFSEFRVYGTTTNHLDDSAVLLTNTTERTLDVLGHGFRNYLVTAVDIHANESSAAVLDLAAGAFTPASERPILKQNSPNPFNPRTTIKYDLPDAGRVRVAVFDVAGHMIRILVDEGKVQGAHETSWNGRDAYGKEAGSGTYFVRLEFGGRVETVRMGLLR